LMLVTLECVKLAWSIKRRGSAVSLSLNGLSVADTHTLNANYPVVVGTAEQCRTARPSEVRRACAALSGATAYDASAPAELIVSNRAWAGCACTVQHVRSTCMYVAGGWRGSTVTRVAVAGVRHDAPRAPSGRPSRADEARC
jgi:hypothetical protein